MYEDIRNRIYLIRDLFQPKCAYYYSDTSKTSYVLIGNSVLVQRDKTLSNSLFESKDVTIMSKEVFLGKFSDLDITLGYTNLDLMISLWMMESADKVLELISNILPYTIHWKDYARVIDFSPDLNILINKLNTSFKFNEPITFDLPLVNERTIEKSYVNSLEVIVSDGRMVHSIELPEIVKIFEYTIILGSYWFNRSSKVRIRSGSRSTPTPTTISITIPKLTGDNNIPNSADYITVITGDEDIELDDVFDRLVDSYLYVLGIYNKNKR